MPTSPRSSSTWEWVSWEKSTFQLWIWWTFQITFRINISRLHSWLNYKRCWKKLQPLLVGSSILRLLHFIISCTAIRTSNCMKASLQLRIKTFSKVDNRENVVNTSSNKLKAFQKRIDTKSEMINSEPPTRHIPLKGTQTKWVSDYLNEQILKLMKETGLTSLQAVLFRNQRQKKNLSWHVKSFFHNFRQGSNSSAKRSLIFNTFTRYQKILSSCP